MPKNMEKNINFEILLFCPRANWHNMVLSHVLPLLCRDKSSLQYSIELDTERGENIKIRIRTIIAEARTLISQFDQHFKNLFSKHNDSPPVPSAKDKDSIFKNFDVNSIHYIYEDSDSDFTPLQLEMSKLLILIFQDLNSDFVTMSNEIVVNLLLLYFHFAQLTNSEKIAILEQLLCEEYKHYDEKSLMSIQSVNEENFNQNKNQLKVMFKEIHKEEMMNFQKQWLRIIKLHLSWLDIKKEEKSKYLLTELNNVLAVKNKVIPYYLVLETLKSFN